MPPNFKEFETTEDYFETTKVVSKAAPREYELVPFNIAFIGFMISAAIYGLFILPSASWYTILFNIITMTAAEIGSAAGSHRLWTHKSYKAKMPLQFVLMVWQSMSRLGTIIEWVRDHRMHHKYTDTDADPHNASRGLFYSHIGWLMVKKHPEVIKRGKDLDLSELKSNPVLQFQHKNSFLMQHTFAFLIPTIIPVYFWGESLSIAWHVNALRYIMNLNMACLVNSLAHTYGYRPYDKNINPTDNAFISAISLGEGFHNYHHVFPRDYRSTELNNKHINLTTMFIDFCGRMGWAYDLKTVTNDVILARSKRTGDGSPTKFEEMMQRNEA